MQISKNSSYLQQNFYNKNFKAKNNLSFTSCAGVMQKRNVYNLSKTFKSTFALGLLLLGGSNASKHLLESLHTQLPASISTKFKMPEVVLKKVNTGIKNCTSFRLEDGGVMCMPKNTDGETIVIDAGHGGKDSGAVSDGIKEKNCNLWLARLITQKLVNDGKNVEMTRYNDTFIPLKIRKKIGNTPYNAHPIDAFVSIHCDETANSNVKGAHSIYDRHDDCRKVTVESYNLAKSIASHLPNSRGVERDVIASGNTLVVLDGYKTPATLVEVGFVSNPFERKALTSEAGMENRANDIVKGIESFIKQSKS